MNSIIKKRVNKIMLKYREYQDFMIRYKYKMSTYEKKQFKESELQEVQIFIDIIDKMLIKLSDDELFIITSIFNLEDEPYLRKFEPGQVPKEEIIFDDEFGKSRAYFYKCQKSAYENLYNYMKILNLNNLQFDEKDHLFFN